MRAGEINLQRIAEKLGLRKEGNKYYCPQHDNETPDLNITKSKFSCFNHKGVEGGYKAVSLVMHTQDWSKQKALNWLKKSVLISKTVMSPIKTVLKTLYRKLSKNTENLILS